MGSYWTHPGLALWIGMDSSKTYRRVKIILDSRNMTLHHFFDDKTESEKIVFRAYPKT